MAGTGAALSRANAALAGLANAMSLPSITGAGGLTTTRVPPQVQIVQARDYYGDGKELYAGARWQRSPVQASGSGRRRSADGAWWQVAEHTIDPCMLGARCSDRTTDSTAAINEALSFANADLNDGFHPVSGARRVVLAAPCTTQTFQVANAAYCISNSIQVNNGGHFEVGTGAELLCLSGFSGLFAIGSSGASMYGYGGSIIVKGLVNCNSVASGIWLRSGSGITVDTRSGNFTNVQLVGIQIGDTSLTIPVYECKITLGRFSTTPVTTYAAAQTANSASSIGIWLTSLSSDNRIQFGEPLGFRTGYQDDGADNQMTGVHPYTAGNSTGSHPTFYGPMTTCFALNGGSAMVSQIQADTPTSMGNAAITAVYGLVFGPNATGYKVRGYQCFLNYDDVGGGLYSSGICTAILCNANDQNGTNSVDGAHFDSASSAIKYQYGISGSPTFFVRKNVSLGSRAAFTTSAFNDYMSAFHRPDIGRTITADRRHNWIDNSAFAIWQWGVGPFNAGASANVAIFGPDRWSSYSDGTGTRAMQPLAVSLAEAAAFYQMQAANALQISQSDTPTGTYWHIEQKFPVSYLQALASKRMTLQFAVKVVSGTLPAGAKVGLRQSFGSGGSADVLTEYAFPATPGANYTRQTATVTWPAITGKTIGAGAFASMYFALPGTGTWTIAVTEVILTEGTEQPVYDYPDDADELRKAQRYYEQVAGMTVNGSQFVQCQPKANTPSCTATVGTVGTITANGALLTGTGNVATTLTFIASEP